MSSTMSFENICYSVPVKGCNPLKKKRKQILHDISGVFKPGMNAILGPTGSGKTTLLDILACRIDKRGLEGVVNVDGKRQPKNFKAVSGYVVQDDLMMGTLTVEENIEFSAHLRLPKETSGKEKVAKVKEVIEELGLTKCAKSKIGTEFIRGVSGGERKRTAIAMELITSPLVLFLDEPTTGLDASTATSVMSTIKRLSQKGKTVIFSIHQPRYAIFRLFDSLMLLSGGRCIFHGKAEEALPYFNSIGFECELHNNPPDFFLDVITSMEKKTKKIEDLEDERKKKMSKKEKKENGKKNGQVAQGEITRVEGIEENRREERGGDRGDDRREEEEEERGEQNGVIHLENGINSHTFANSTYLEMEAKDTHQILHSRFKQSPYSKTLDEELQTIKTNEENKELLVKCQYNSSFFTQLFYVSKRTLINSFRSPATILLQAMVSILTAVIVGCLYLQVNQKEGETAVQNRVGAMFFVTVNQMFSSLSSLELFIREKSIFIHESSSGYYRVSVYFIAKVICDVIPLRLIPVTVFSIISYFMIGFQMVAYKFFLYYLALFLITLAATSLSIVMSCSVDIFALANLSISLLFVLMMLFAGFLVNLESIGAWLRWLQYFSIIRYAFNILATNEFEDLLLYTNGTASSGSKVLDGLKIDYGTPWLLGQNILALIIIIAALLFLAYVQLRRIPKHK